MLSAPRYLSPSSPSSAILFPIIANTISHHCMPCLWLRINSTYSTVAGRQRVVHSSHHHHHHYVCHACTCTFLSLIHPFIHPCPTHHMQVSIWHSTDTRVWWWRSPMVQWWYHTHGMVCIIVELVISLPCALYHPCVIIHMLPPPIMVHGAWWWCMPLLTIVDSIGT